MANLIELFADHVSKRTFSPPTHLLSLSYSISSFHLSRDTSHFAPPLSLVAGSTPFRPQDSAHVAIQLQPISGRSHARRIEGYIIRVHTEWNILCKIPLHRPPPARAYYDIIIHNNYIIIFRLPLLDRCPRVFPAVNIRYVYYKTNCGFR